MKLLCKIICRNILRKYVSYENCTDKYAKKNV
jgi:hypothetical protein